MCAVLVIHVLLSNVMCCAVLCGAGYEALRAMKQLRHCGVPLSPPLYTGLLRALSCFRGAANEGTRPPLHIFASLRAEVMAGLLLQEMRNDGVTLNSALVCALVGLFRYPAQWHRAPRSEVEDAVDKCPALSSRGEEASRQAVQAARRQLDEACRAGGLPMDADMVAALVGVCCAGRQVDLALELISSSATTSRAQEEEDREHQQGEEGALSAHRVPLTAAVYEPLLVMYCQSEHPQEGLRLAEDLLASMQAEGVLPSPFMLGQVLATAQRAGEEDGGGMSQLSGAVLKVRQLHAATGVLPARKAVLALLGSLLAARNRAEGRMWERRRASEQNQDEVARLLEVVGELYSPRQHQHQGKRQRQQIHFQDLERVFAEHDVNMAAYDLI